MRECTETLLKMLGVRGPILTYSSYERTIIRALAVRFEDLAPRLLELIPRIVDLLPITKAHYYHPDMKGSWSIKSVLPTIAPELDYSSLQIQEGNAAADGFLEMIDPTTSSERRAENRTALLAYCKQDTLALVKVAQALANGES